MKDSLRAISVKNVTSGQISLTIVAKNLSDNRPRIERRLVVTMLQLFKVFQVVQWVTVRRCLLENALGLCESQLSGPDICRHRDEM